MKASRAVKLAYQMPPLAGKKNLNILIDRRLRCVAGGREHTFICMRVRPHLHRVTNALYLREQNNNGRSEERSTLVNVGIFDEDTGNEEKYILCETADIKRGRKKCVCVHGCECLPARRIMIK